MKHYESLIEELKKQDSALWNRIARELSRSSRNVAKVNVGKFEKVLKEGETAIVPGKVLGVGFLQKPVKVIALSISKSAEEKIKKAGGSYSTIATAIKTKPTKVRIIK